MDPNGRMISVGHIDSLSKNGTSFIPKTPSSDTGSEKQEKVSCWTQLRRVLSPATFTPGPKVRKSVNFGLPVDISNRIVINISGRRFEAPESVFTNHPKTLLGNPKKREVYFDFHRDEYFFNRVQECFPAILYYFQCGKLRRPAGIELDTFLAEISFFQLGKFFPFTSFCTLLTLRFLQAGDQPPGENVLDCADAQSFRHATNRHRQFVRSHSVTNYIETA